ncbi:hypothetical protein A3Q33_06880 [Colwellia sp. PAMC 21821]|nr:hypothetical protein A3Q33_06880 [Colwellia sp. PAMC 21821]
MMVISLVMIKNPQTFATGIIKFSQQTYFHVVEILSRLFFGVVFVYYSPLTLAPSMNAALGYLMIFAAILLLVIGANKHRKFALWSAEKFSSRFRISGFSLSFLVVISFTLLGNIKINSDYRY